MRTNLQKHFFSILCGLPSVTSGFWPLWDYILGRSQVHFELVNSNILLSLHCVHTVMMAARQSEGDKITQVFESTLTFTTMSFKTLSLNFRFPQ